VISDAQLREGLARWWGLADVQVAAHHGGMNSATWFASRGGRRWVAKAVPPGAVMRFRGGLAVASALDRAGIACGAPVPTSDGQPTATVDGVPVALLSWVPGEPLTRSRQRLIGVTLARVHEVLATVRLDADLVDEFLWIDVTASHLAIRPWLRDHVTSAVAALDSLGPLTEGLLHSDPAPEAFRWDQASGHCGLIDWSVALRGPLLYDLASAVMYAGGHTKAGELLAAYLDRRLIASTEISRGLSTMLRFRWAVQADYFARRLVACDLTGIADADENERGLEDAGRALVDDLPGRSG
jgi:Ser/Thr protein kinase RdoA (MazF antagonist)